MKYRNLTEAILISFLVIFTFNIPVFGQGALPLLTYSVFHIDDPNAPCGNSPCETLLIRFSDHSMMSFGARNLTGQNIFWDSTFQFSDNNWTQYMMGTYQLWIEGIIWGNSTCETSSTWWTKMKSFQISEVNESYSGIYPQLYFNITFEEIVLPDVDGISNNITLIVSHKIIGKENESLIKLSIYLDLTNFIPYWNNSGLLTPFSPDQKIFIGIIYRTVVIASRDLQGVDHEWIVPDFCNESSVIWTIEGMQCTSMHFERNAKRLESGLWIEENASSYGNNDPNCTLFFFNHIVPNCSVNTTWVLIDPIIAVNGDFRWWSEETIIEGFSIGLIMGCLAIYCIVLFYRSKKSKMT